MTKRNVILTTALRLFNEHGYHAVGVDRIRDEAQVSKMTLYNHFSNKNKLVEEVLKLRHVMFKHSLESSISEFYNPHERLREIFNWHARWFCSDDFHGCMFIKATGEFHDVADFLAVSKYHKLWVARLIEHIFVDMNDPFPSMKANVFQVILDGMIVNASIFNSFERVNEVWEELCRSNGFPIRPLDEPIGEFSILNFSPL